MDGQGLEAMGENLPEAPIIEQAKKFIGEDADDLAVLQFLMQASTAANTARMRKLAEAKIPTGFKHLEYTVPADEVFVVQLGTPFIAFTLKNKSNVAGVYMCINEQKKLNEDSPIPPQNSANITMELPIIKTIYLKSATAGVSVDVTIFGIEGKRKW